MTSKRELQQTAEQCVLASVLRDGEVMGDVVTMLGAEDFVEKDHANVWTAMSQLYQGGSPIEPVALAALSGADLDYLVELNGMLGSGANARHYGSMVREASLRRKVGKLGEDIAKSAQGDWDANIIMDRAQSRLLDLANAAVPEGLRQASRDVRAAMRDTEEAAQSGGAPRGPTIGLPALDKRLTGFKRSSYNIIAARPSMGKTALAVNNLILHNLKQGKRVALFSLEMDGVSIMHRITAALSGLDNAVIASGKMRPDQWKTYIDACADAERLTSNLLISDSAVATPLSIRADLRRAMIRGPIDLVVVDYIQLMTSHEKAENRQQEVSSISRGLKMLTQETKIPLVALSQLSRGVEMRADPIPRLPDLRESGSLEQDADVVMFIHRYEDGRVTFNIAKQRNGPTGLVSFGIKFSAGQTRFMEMAEGAGGAD